MKVLILVLSARRTPWNALMELSQETWDSEIHPRTKTIYYCGKGGPSPGEKLNPAWCSASDKSDVFYSPALGEELEEVSARTLEALEFSLGLDWDFLARPHSSCYVHKKHLVEFCETLPGDNSIYGIMTDGPNPFLWGGCHYIITRQAVEQMVANKDKWNLKVMEDRSLTQMVNELGITVRGGRSATINLMPNGSFMMLVYGIGENFVFTDWADIQKLHPHFFVRCKHDPDRTQDLRIFRELFAHYK